MKYLTRFKNLDIIKINGEELQVIDNMPNWYHRDKKELEMGVGLIKVGSKSITPDYSLSYMENKPKEVKFFKWDKNAKESKEIKLKSLIFPK